METTKDVLLNIEIECIDQNSDILLNAFNKKFTHLIQISPKYVEYIISFKHIHQELF